MMQPRFGNGIVIQYPGGESPGKIGRIGFRGVPKVWENARYIWRQGNTASRLMDNCSCSSRKRVSGVTEICRMLERFFEARDLISIHRFIVEQRGKCQGGPITV